MTELERPFPAFLAPPAIETLLGVQFAPLDSLSVPHLGVYWSQIRSAYPRQEVRPPLLSITEESGREQATEPGIRLEPLREPLIRCWFIDDSSAHLIQVQKDRFIRNWRRVKAEDPYFHYDTLKPKFRGDWQRFCDFLEQEKLGAPDVNQCEVTYVNHIEVGQELRSYADAHKVMGLVSQPASAVFLPEPEMLNLSASYLMPDKKGRLNVTLQPAMNRRTGSEVLQLTLTARGRPASSGIEDIIAWFDLGHEWVVRGFADLTTTDMHAKWRRTS